MSNNYSDIEQNSDPSEDKYVEDEWTHQNNDIVSQLYR